MSAADRAPTSTGSAGVIRGASPEVWLVDVGRGADALIALERETPRLAAEDRARALAGSGGVAAHDGSRQRLATYIALRLVLERAFGPGVRGRGFARSAFGRPSLPDFGGDFSLAHAGDHALIAVTPRGRVGVDLERRRSISMAAARRAAIETAGIALGGDLPHPGGDADGRFLAAWVRLEAYVKARQSTLAKVLTAVGALGGVAPPGTIDVAERLAALDVPQRPADGHVWVRDLAVPAEHWAAVAWTGGSAGPERSPASAGAGGPRSGDPRSRGPVPEPPPLRILPIELAALRALAGCA